MALGLPASALIFRDGSSPAANTETAPTGAYADSGWQYQIRFGAFHGTMISPKHFLTAVHLGTAPTSISQPIYFNGVEEKTYGIKPGSRETIGTTDLAIFEIWETFDDYAQLYSQGSEAGKGMVICGRGFGRGTELAGQGWKWGAAATRQSRWGRNTVDGFLNSGGNDLLYFDFDDVLGQDEAAATGGDSGGGWFIKDGPIWKLAAVSFSVDGRYSDAATPSDASSFRGAFYDAGGLWWGNDANGWNLLPTTGSSTNPNVVSFYRNSHTYGSRISSNLSAIELVIDPAIAWAAQTPAQRFLSWLSSFGVTGATAESDDADADGITNLEEYLSESDPSDGNETVSPLEIEFLPDGTHQFTLVESLDLAGRGLTTTLQSSVDLDIWTAVSDSTESSNAPDNALGIRTRILGRTPSSCDALFYRLKITLTSP